MKHGDLPEYPRASITPSFVLSYIFEVVFEAAIWASLAKFLVSDSMWQGLLDWWGERDPMYLFILGSIVVHAVMYYGMNLTFLFCHHYGVLSKYQLPRTDGQPFPDNARLKQTILEGSLSHVTSLPIGSYVLWRLMSYFGATMAGPLPSWMTMVAQLSVAYFVLDFTFYWAHRAFHTPTLYRLFHKKHHQYKWTIGFAAEWAHPVEHFFANQLTMTVAVIVMGVHGFTWWVWLAFRLWDTYQHHSGFAIPFLFPEKTEVHDFHHTHNVGNYSSEFMDALFGTNDAWVMKRRKQLKAKQQQ